MSNQGLAHVTGEFIAVLAELEQLPRHALFKLVQSIQQFSDSVLIYADRDFINSDGQRGAPISKRIGIKIYFTQNFPSGLTAYRTD
ncbi:MAG: hypothetical protein R3E08_12985 [Thiotrichaceae bacterium]